MAQQISDLVPAVPPGHPHPATRLISMVFRPTGLARRAMQRNSPRAAALHAQVMVAPELSITLGRSRSFMLRVTNRALLCEANGCRGEFALDLISPTAVTADGPAS